MTVETSPLYLYIFIRIVHWLSFKCSYYLVFRLNNLVAFLLHVVIVIYS